jgi:hypothetical protein
MTSKTVAAGTFLLFAGLGAAAWGEGPKPDAEGFMPIFNGRDMTGWAGLEGWWSVEDGALTSQSTKEKPCTRCNYLMWRGGKAADFELKLNYRIIGGNSGIQFRSRELPGWDIAGYQADMEAGDQWTGCLYDVNTGRAGVSMRGEKTVIDADGKKHVVALGNPAELAKAVKKGDWNEYHVIAKGNHIILKINGAVMTEVADHEKGKASREGIFAFQMHPGPPMKVQFKDIRLKRLK